jgi:ABC-type cobalamin/Fe3+-siderophores transport system ATPase subunit
MTPPAIALQGLAVRAGGRTILRVDDLAAPAGQIVALLGPNGAGKSTLLHCLLGLAHHVTGRVEILGQPVGQLGGGALARLRRRVGYVPQHLPQISELPLTVREVVAIGQTGRAGLLRPLGRTHWQRVDTWIDRLGLGELAGRGFGEISGGEQRKTLIARAMAQQPKLLLLDEPTANLDLGWRERIVATVEQLAAETSLGVILVCHELEVLPGCLDRVVLLDGGRVIDDGSAEVVLTNERIASLYGPGLAVTRSGRRWAVVPEGGGDD